MCEWLRVTVSHAHILNEVDLLTTMLGFIPHSSHNSFFPRFSTMRSAHACERGGEGAASRFDEWAVHLCYMRNHEGLTGSRRTWDTIL
jgi:hypothetical protein